MNEATSQLMMVVICVPVQNYHLKVEQTGHYQTLIQQARQYDKEIDEAEKVDRETVDVAFRELHQFSREVAQELEGMLCSLVYSVNT